MRQEIREIKAKSFKLICNFSKYETYKWECCWCFFCFVFVSFLTNFNILFCISKFICFFNMNLSTNNQKHLSIKLWVFSYTLSSFLLSLHFYFSNFWICSFIYVLVFQFDVLTFCTIISLLFFSFINICFSCYFVCEWNKYFNVYLFYFLNEKWLLLLLLLLFYFFTEPKW